MKAARPKRTRQRAAVKAVVPEIAGMALKAVEEIIGHRFKDPDLLSRALTHPSAVSASDSIRLSNQRLEFLGDRVLNLIIAERLFSRRKMESEGDLAPRLNQLVKKGACADAMRHLDLGRFLILSEGEESAGGRMRESTLGDACEAILGAIFVDSGLAPARRFVEAGWAPQFANAPAETRDPKTLLQEWAQAKGLPLPNYRIVDRTGPDHAPVYEVEVSLPGHGHAGASGASKRDAERLAAASLLSLLTGSQ